MLKAPCRLDSDGSSSVRSDGVPAPLADGGGTSTAAATRCAPNEATLVGIRLDGHGRPFRVGRRYRLGITLSIFTTSDELSTKWGDPTTRALLEAAVMAAEEKIGADPVILHLAPLADTCDALVVTSGRNDRHTRAIAEEIERLVELATCVKPSRIEGLDTAEWILLDYGHVMIHVFTHETRDFYDLEHLWGAAESLRVVH